MPSTHAEFLAESLSNPRKSNKDNSQPVEMADRKGRSILKNSSAVAPSGRVSPAAVKFSTPARQASASVSASATSQSKPDQLDSVTEKLMKKTADDLLPRSQMIDYRTRSQLASLGLISSLPLPPTSPRRETETNPDPSIE